MNKRPILFAAAFASILGCATSASAFSVNIGVGVPFVPPPGYYYDPDNHHYDNWGISAQDAVDIAHHNGVRRVDDVSRRSNTYEVGGWDRHNHYLTVVVDRRNGDVIDIDR